MRRGRPLVAIAEPIDPVALDWLMQHCDCAGLESIKDAGALIVRTSTRVDRALLDSAPHLRVIGRAGVGVDHIDLAACAQRGIPVVHTPDANTDAVVEYVFAEIFEALRPRPAVRGAMTSAEWERVRKDAVAPAQLHGSTLGVLGFGRIGSKVGAVGAALGMRVLCCDLRTIGGGAAQVGFEELLRSSDILTVHVDGRTSNRGLLDAAAFAQCKPAMCFINASRGFVVDHAALASFLQEHPGARAVCDVHEPEPVESDHPMLGLPNAKLTPHIASATADAKRAMSWVVRDVWRVCNGEAPEHVAVAGEGSLAAE